MRRSPEPDECLHSPSHTNRRRTHESNLRALDSIIQRLLTLVIAAGAYTRTIPRDASKTRHDVE